MIYWDDVKDFGKILLFTIGCAFFIVLPIIAAPALLLGAWSCQNYSDVTGRATDYEWLDGCYVKTDSGWQRWSEYEARATASEGLKGLE